MRLLTRTRLLLTLCAAALLTLPCRAEDVTIHAFVKAEGQVAHVLVRVPLSILNRAELPLQTANGELDIARAHTLLPSVARWWIAENFELYDDGIRSTPPRVARAMVALASDSSFNSYASAWAHLMESGPNPDIDPGIGSDAHVIADQAVLDVLLDYPIRSTRARLAVHPLLARLGPSVTTELQFVSSDDPSGGAVRAFEFRGDPGLFALDPGWTDVLRRFVPLGFKDIVTDTGSLLLLFSAALLMRRISALVPFVAAFTFAAIATFIASSFGLAPDALWLTPVVGALASLAILYLAFENIAGGVMPAQYRWIFALVTGFVYGFSFYFVFQPTQQFAGSHMLAGPLSYTLGMFLAEVAMLTIFTLAVSFLVRLDSSKMDSPKMDSRKRMGTIVAAALIADASWHRLTEYSAQVGQFSLRWPTWDASLFASVATWIAIFSLTSGAAFVAFGLWNRRGQGPEVGLSQPPEPNHSDEAATLGR